MFIISARTQKIFACYEGYQTDFLTTSIGWDGTTASQPANVTSPVIDADHLLFAGNANFTNANATVRISSSTPSFNWMVAAPGVDTPVHAVFGTVAQVNQYVYLVEPFFLYRQGILSMNFTNSATSLTSSTAKVTWMALKLQNRILNSQLPWETSPYRG